MMVGQLHPYAHALMRNGNPLVGIWAGGGFQGAQGSFLGYGH